MQVGVGQALDLVDVVRRRQLPAAPLLEVRQGVDVLQLRRGKIEVAGLAGRIGGEGGMGLIADAGPDVDVVDAVGHRRRVGVLGQGPAGSVEMARLGHFRGGKGDQGVGPLEVMVLQGRLVDLGGEGRFVLGVGLGRVQVLGTAGEGGVEDVLALVRRGIGTVPGRAVAG